MSSTNRDYHHLILAPVAALLSFSVAYHGAAMPSAAAYTLAVTVWVAWWWISEALPLPVTSLLPFVLLPLGGVLSESASLAALGNPIILLFMGAFMLAKAVEHSGVHQRIALALIRLIGDGSGQRVIFAFMTATAVLSMWISNTAAVLALLPVALALADACDDASFQRALLLGLAYAASVGGIATLVGTPPNLIFASVYQSTTGQAFGFLAWMKIGIPLVVISIPIMAWWLSRNLRHHIKLELPPITAISSAEKRVLAIFSAVILLWVFRTAPFGGWVNWLQLPAIGDASVALAGVVAMFVIRDRQAQPLLTWQLASNIPWGILLLFAGGITLAQGFMSSGLSGIIGNSLMGLTTLPTWLLVLTIALIVSFLTEFTSNTATATLLMPVMAATGVALGLPVEVLMITAAIACSCAFCLPVATPPNSIVFASERITIQQMAREGMVLNIILALITTLVVMLFVG